MTTTETLSLAGLALLLLHKPKASGSSSAPSSTTYTVQSGDSLSLIAQAQYGDLQLWPLLYDANRSTIGPDYNAIQVGQVLTIPALSSFSQSQLDDAHARAANWQPSNPITSTIEKVANYSNADGTASVEGL